MFRIYAFTLGPLLLSLFTLILYYLFKKNREKRNPYGDKR